MFKKFYIISVTKKINNLNSSVTEFNLLNSFIVNNIIYNSITTNDLIAYTNEEYNQRYNALIIHINNSLYGFKESDVPVGIIEVSGVTTTTTTVPVTTTTTTVPVTTTTTTVPITTTTTTVPVTTTTTTVPCCTFGIGTGTIIISGGNITTTTTTVPVTTTTTTII